MHGIEKHPGSVPGLLHLSRSSCSYQMLDDIYICPLYFSYILSGPGMKNHSSECSECRDTDSIGLCSVFPLVVPLVSVGKTVCPLLG